MGHDKNHQKNRLLSERQVWILKTEERQTGFDFQNETSTETVKFRHHKVRRLGGKTLLRIQWMVQEEKYLDDWRRGNFPEHR